MATAPAPPIDEPGVYQAVEEGFITALRQPLAGYAIYADKETRTGDWWNEELKWRDIAEMDDVQVSMDFPPVSADSTSTSTNTVQMPILSKDLQMGGRRARQMVASGLDPQVFREQAWAMAKETNSYLLTGTDSDTAGNSTGLLDTGGTTSGGDWSNHDTMNQDLGNAIAQVLDRNHTSPFTLMLNTVDADVLNIFIGDGPDRMVDHLPNQVNRVLVDKNVTAGEAHVIADTPWFDVVAPRDDPEVGFMFGLGSVTAGPGPNDNPAGEDAGGTRQERFREMTRTTTIRVLNILSPRFSKTGTGDDGAGAQKVTYTQP